MRLLKLMADYQCFPLWEASPGVVGNVDPRDLAISTTLQRRLMAWAAEFDSTLDINEPTQSGFKTEQMLENFKKTGDDLASQLREEIGPDFSIQVKVLASVKAA